jgi:hypothetical protein
MKPVPIDVVGPLALAGCSGKIESPTDVTGAGAALNARLKKILAVGVAFFALGCASAQAQDMALNRSASASSTENNRTDLRPALANDGNSFTRWSSNFVDDQWWRVDLGSVRQIDRVELNWETAYASRYRIETRTSTLDSWSTAATVTISSPGLKVHTFSARNARYVRIYGDTRATRWGISLWDLRVCNETCGESPPPPPPPSAPQCSDGIDNADLEDTLIDLADPGCTDASDDDESDLPPPPPPGGITLAEVDGGPTYYGQFSNALPTDRSYFPVAVWGSYNHTQQNRDRDAAMGINTYVWVADSTFMDDIRADGRFKVIQDEGSRSNVGSETAGWLLGDEIDMTQGPSACPGAIDSIRNGLPADNRFRYANYGKGVLIWGATGYNRHNDTSSACFMNRQDVTSTDLYWHTDPYETSHPQSNTSWGYGWSMRRMRNLDAQDGKRQPQWGFVEVGHPFDNGGTITPSEIRGAVWHTLIAGARGIIYFQHSFGGSCPAHHALRDPDPCYANVQTMVKAVNEQIKGLAPVLNAPFVMSGHSVTGSVDHMVKWANGKFYVFAAARSATNATFSIPCVGDATAVRLAPSNLPGEAASIPVNQGSFTDSFADGNATHVYRIDGGISCGL